MEGLLRFLFYSFGLVLNSFNWWSVKEQTFCLTWLQLQCSFHFHQEYFNLQFAIQTRLVIKLGPNNLLNWIPNRKQKWFVFQISWNFTRSASREFWVQSRQKTWERVIYPMIRCSCLFALCSTSTTPFFPLKILSTASYDSTLWGLERCMPRDGRGGPGDRSLNSRKLTQVKNGCFFHHTCTLQLPACRLCLLKFWKVHRGRINNISKGQVEDKRRDGAMTGAFPTEKGGWFFGWFFFGSLVLWLGNKR